VARATGALASVSGFDPDLDRLAARVEGLALELEDVGVELGTYASGVEADPDELAALEHRIDLLERLRRKHGGSVEAVLAHAEWCREQIDRLENSESRELELASEVERLEGERERAAAELSAGREAAAAEISERVSATLADLAMEGARLSVELRPLADGFGPSGAETVEFMLSTNAGIAAQPLRDAASGGELSRVMLALAGIGAGTDGAGASRSLVFDEIDAGIGGNTASVVGDKLRDVADRRQVIAITHLPQVASKAGTHFTITKDSGGEPATATVELLAGEAVIEEIRRMLGAGTGDDAATRHARELVESAR
jgi:DNA repair protein RecN (Recombination protein N)